MTFSRTKPMDKMQKQGPSANRIMLGRSKHIWN